MATASQADITVTNEWQDIVDTDGDLASVDVLIQNKPSSNDTVNVVFGGTEPATKDVGFVLGPKDSVTGNAAAIWVRSQGETGNKIAVATI